MNTIARYLQCPDIFLDVRVADRAELFDKVGGHMEREHGLDKAAVIAALAHRERIGSTAIGQGVAVPHARIKDLQEICVAYLRLNPPIAYAAPDDRLVSDIMVLLVPKQATEEHLVMLADTSQMFADQGFRARLGECGNAAQAKRQFDAWPRPA